MGAHTHNTHTHNRSNSLIVDCASVCSAKCAISNGVSARDCNGEGDAVHTINVNVHHALSLLSSPSSASSLASSTTSPDGDVFGVVVVAMRYRIRTTEILGMHSPAFAVHDLQLPVSGSDGC